MKESLILGLRAESSVKAGPDNTAAVMGSGDLDVFATPAMIALAENAAMKAVAPFLDDGETTVGNFVEMSHLKPTVLGNTVTAKATLTGIEGRRLTFSVHVSDTAGAIGEGRHVRYIVDRAKFLSKINHES